MARISQQTYGYTRGGIKTIAEDRPSVQRVHDGVRLELTGQDAVWVIDLTEADCERIAEAIGWGRPRI